MVVYFLRTPSRAPVTVRHESEALKIKALAFPLLQSPAPPRACAATFIASSGTYLYRMYHRHFHGIKSLENILVLPISETPEDVRTRTFMSSCIDMFTLFTKVPLFTDLASPPSSPLRCLATVPVSSSSSSSSAFQPHRLLYASACAAPVRTRVESTSEAPPPLLPPPDRGDLRLRYLRLTNCPPPPPPCVFTSSLVPLPCAPSISLTMSSSRNPRPSASPPAPPLLPPPGMPAPSCSARRGSCLSSIV